ncbi:2-hydroxyacyl-CoA lyase 1-like [Diaphorina citri]|uniref:2-hydroxyacyl-CoA lyase 1-like n=1 Tax=Diaphorina citri TaxID=121845 RepID=A0A1S3D2K7_DIACI|nr:2-hydroxyacyl-CoA lyase 1-like [Diaphorina citri]
MPFSTPGGKAPEMLCELSGLPCQFVSSTDKPECTSAHTKSTRTNTTLAWHSRTETSITTHLGSKSTPCDHWQSSTIYIRTPHVKALYGGFDEATYASIVESGEVTTVSPPTSLSPSLRYEKMMAVFGHDGYLCTTVPQIKQAMQKCLQTTTRPSLINILINPSADRKPQNFSWLTESKL